MVAHREAMVGINNIMNYNKIYADLIDRARAKKIAGYKETHHIVPRCLGGTNDQTNLVDLTFEEHFMAHLLLVKIYPDDHRLIYAANRMCSGHHGKRTTRKLYGWLRKRFVQAVAANQTAEGNSQFGSCWISNPITLVSKKLSSTEVIPEGWVKGRNRKFVDCRECGYMHLRKSPFCSETCSKLWVSKNLSCREISDETRQKLRDNNWARTAPIAQRAHAAENGKRAPKNKLQTSTSMKKVWVDRKNNAQ